MMRLTLRVTAIAAIAAVVTATPAMSHAQKAPAADPDMQVLASYRLTEGTLHKVMQAGRNLAAMAKDPTVRESMQSQDDQPEAKTIAAMAAQFDAVPPMKKALASAGLTSREYAVFTLSLLQASFAAALMDAKGQYQLKELPKGTPRENVDFVRAHRAELQRYGEEMKALTTDAAEPSGEEPASGGTDSLAVRR